MVKIHRCLLQMHPPTAAPIFKSKKLPPPAAPQNSVGVEIPSWGDRFLLTITAGAKNKRAGHHQHHDRIKEEF